MTLVWVSRLTSTLLTAAVLFVGAVWAEGPAARRFTFIVEVKAPATTTAQLFFDDGRGFRQEQSTAASVPGSDIPIELRLPLPRGHYRALRFDPGAIDGEYQFGPARIESETGHVVARFGPRTFNVAGTLRETSRSDAWTIATALDNDPQTVAVFTPPLSVTSAGESAATGVASVLVAFGLVLLLDRTAAGGLRQPWFARLPVERHGMAVVMLAAFAGTVAATYPLWVGRSLVSPGTGSSVMLYDRPPFVAQGQDFMSEDARGTDTGSMMWGILPYSKVQRQAIAEREWPLWQRYSGLGRPLWGQGQSMFLDPLHLASLAFSDPATGWDFKFVAGRLIFASGIGVATLLATQSVFAGALIAAAAPFLGYFTFRLNHPAAFSVTYLPWMLIAWIMLARQKDWGPALHWSAWGSAATVLHLVGSTPKEGAINLLACQVFAVIALVCASGDVTARMRRVTAFAIGGLAALLASAPHWLIFVDGLSRAWTVYDVPSVRLAIPHDLAALALGPIASGTVWPGANMLIAVGAALSITAPSTRRGLAVWLASSLTVVGCLAVALGAVPTPWLLATPFIRNLHSVHTAFFGAALTPLLLLAGFGFAQLGPGRQWTPMARAVGLACALAMSVAIAYQQAAATAALSALPAALLVTLAAAIVFPFVTYAWTSGTPTRHAAPAALGTALLMLLPAGLHLDTGVATADRLLMQPRPRADLDDDSAAVAAARRVTTEPFRAIGVDYVFFAGTQALFGIEGVIGADAVEWRELRELGQAAGMFRHPWGWLSVFSLADLGQMSPLLDMFGVRVVFSATDMPVPFLPRIEAGASDRIDVYQRPSVWPRAFFDSAVAIYNDPADLLRQLDTTRAPFVAVQASDADAVAATGDLRDEPSRPQPARNYALTVNSTSFDVVAPSAGVVLLAEAYEPRDFVATLNGQRVPYFRVNHLFKAVRIPAAGTWRVHFTYRPRFWGAAWMLAVVGVASIGLMIMAARLLRTRRASERNLTTSNEL